MVQSPSTFFEEEDLPPGILLRDPSHLRQEEVLTLWDFLASRQKDGHVGLIFSGCDPQDKRKDMGMGLTWKAKGKRPDLTGFDCSSSSSDDEDEEGSGDESLEDEVGEDMGSLAKGKGKSAYLKADNNTGGPHQEEGSQGIDAPDQVDLAEILHDDIQAPANAGDSKEEKLSFLTALSKEGRYQTMVQWLKANLVRYFFSSILDVNRG